MHQLDLKTLRCLYAVADRRWLRLPVRAYTLLGVYGVGWSVTALIGAASDSQRREHWLRAAAVPPLALLTNSVVKQIVRRDRPQVEGLQPVGTAPATYSFPSAHATTSFAAAAAISRCAPAARGPLLLAAAAMALTRPALGYHYPSDSLAGGALGLLVERALPSRMRP